MNWGKEFFYKISLLLKIQGNNIESAMSEGLINNSDLDIGFILLLKTLCFKCADTHILRQTRNFINWFSETKPAISQLILETIDTNIVANRKV